MGVCLVTGGAKRLGAEICRTLAKEGYDLVIHYRDSRHEALELKKECQEHGVGAEIIFGDFTTTESTKNFIAEYVKSAPEAHYLINNVGNYLKEPLISVSDEEWLEVFQTNLHAPFFLTRALLPHLKSVVNIGVAGLDAWRTDPHSTAYRMTKMTLWMLTRSLARELKEQGVRVNMVSPGQLEQSVNLPKSLPMGRAGTFQEVSEAVHFLLKNDYITGQNLEVAGGLKL